MTDDEAFIRSIVDNPDDDAPRLVYADWLDERDDPRGAYLRATVLWGRQLNDVETHEKAERQLRHARRSLDQTWVCRVTKPPLGVCCDRISIHDRGRLISPSRIGELESRLRVKLPADYQAFLLNYNGGIPQPNVYQLGYSHFSRVQAFFVLGEWMTSWVGGSPDDSLERFAEKLNATGEGKAFFFPVASTIESHCATDDLEADMREATTSWSANLETCLCITADTHSIVRVHIDMSPEALHGRIPFSVEPVANSLATLLNQLDELPDGWEPNCF